MAGVYPSSDPGNHCLDLTTPIGHGAFVLHTMDVYNVFVSAFGVGLLVFTVFVKFSHVDAVVCSFSLSSVFHPINITIN